MADKDVDFQSFEELAAILEKIGLSVHAKNRIAGGEDNFVWYLAEAVRSVGQLAARAENEPQLHGLYGDAYQAGELAHNVQLDHFFGLLREEFSAGK